ncbi:MAG: NAD(P)-binding domain-containing protein [Proteobacteria bacterium]|nr:NAD(P)-binding domain-containing protein [Pseudomonadota bacterium]
MRIAILGTGDVAQQLGTKLAAIGHQVQLGSRSHDHPSALAWAAKTGGDTSTFELVATWGEVVFNCTSGQHSLKALRLAGHAALDGKILIDVSNPLDFSNGFPPTLSIANTDSLGEQIQHSFPEAKVVKALNTVANHLMVDPGQVDGPASLPICGDDAEAKAKVSAWMTEWFGWEDVIDLGPIESARATEAWLLMWTRLYGALGTGNFHMAIVR